MCSEIRARGPLKGAGKAVDSASMGRAKALRKVAAAYVWGFVAGAATIYGLEALAWSTLLWRVAVADLAATVVVFGFSLRWNNSSVYDAYWSVLPIWLAAYLAWVGVASGANLVRVLVVLALVVAWGVRLTHNWARGWTGFDHEDWRYVDIRATTGKLYWLVSLLGIHLFPTALVFLGCLPLFAIMTEPGAALGWLDGVALVVTAGAIAIELVADNTLRDYALHRKKPGETLTEGIWGWSRHPNYFGELSFWWGIYLFGVAAVGFEPAWMIAGALAISVQLNFISVPLIEKRMRERRPDFAQVEARVSRLVPWPPRG